MESHAHLNDWIAPVLEEFEIGLVLVQGHPLGDSSQLESINFIFPKTQVYNTLSLSLSSSMSSWSPSISSNWSKPRSSSSSEPLTGEISRALQNYYILKVCVLIAIIPHQFASRELGLALHEVFSEFAA